MYHFEEKYINPFKDEDSLKYYRDLKNSLDTARDEGREEGIEIGIEKRIEKGIEIVAKNAKKMGKSISEIIELTGLTKEQIDKLKLDIK